MRTKLFLLALLTLGTVGCDQMQQTKLLTVREEFDKEIKTKDKTIEDLNKKINDLDQRNSQLEQRLIKESGGSSDKLAAAVTEAVSKTIAEQTTANFAAVRSDLGEVLKTLKSGATVVAAAPSAAAAPVLSAPAAEARTQAPAAPAVRSTAEPRDPNTKKYKMVW